jgi:hypothetical protein
MIYCQRATDSGERYVFVTSEVLEEFDFTKSTFREDTFGKDVGNLHSGKIFAETDFLDGNGFTGINRFGGTVISGLVTERDIPDNPISSLSQLLCDAKLVVHPELLVHDLEQRMSLMCHPGNSLSDTPNHRSQRNTPSQPSKPATQLHRAIARRQTHGGTRDSPGLVADTRTPNYPGQIGNWIAASSSCRQRAIQAKQRNSCRGLLRQRHGQSGRLRLRKDMLWPVGCCGQTLAEFARLSRFEGADFLNLAASALIGARVRGPPRKRE